MLLPLTGQAAGIGQTMSHAAQLAQGASGRIIDLDILDTQGRPERAAEAAGTAVDDGAQLVLGPLFGDEVPSVMRAIDGRAPLVTFSNNALLADQGAFVFGITPDQSVSAILRYARDRGVKSFAVVAEPGDLGRRAVSIAQSVATETGLKLTSTRYLNGNGNQSTLLDDLRADGKGRLPDAVLLPDGGSNLGGLATLFDGTGMQLLGTVQWSRQDLANMPALVDAWFAAPDPRAFSSFTEAYQARYAGNAGILAGLAFDAVTMAQNLALSGNLDRAGITLPAGFSGVVGDFRFRADGQCRRDMAILAVNAASVNVVDKITAA